MKRAVAGPVPFLISWGLVSGECGEEYRDAVPTALMVAVSLLSNFWIDRGVLRVSKGGGGGGKEV